MALSSSECERLAFELNATERQTEVRTVTGLSTNPPLPVLADSAGNVTEMGGSWYRYDRVSHLVEAG